jgi:3-isopropylmalate/(R)-2-methylmalate dehydratase small subunit
VDAFRSHTGRIAPLRRSNVDTDQIIPAVYLKRVTRTGFEDGLFAAWRGKEPGFVLNRPEYADASILVAGNDFGTGSSREHAVWALLDYGFRVVIAPRYGDIFRGNSLKAGLLTVVLGQATVDTLWQYAERDPAAEVTVDLEAREVRASDRVFPFDIDDYARWRLIQGLDDVSVTQQHEDDITAFEAARPQWLPVTG